MEPSSIRSAIDTDAVLHDAMVRTGHDDPKDAVDLGGKNREQERLAERLAVQREAGIEATIGIPVGLAKSALERRLEPYVEGPVLGMIEAGLATIKGAFKNLEDERSLNRAVRRESAIAACALLCEGVLPESYRTHVLAGLVGGRPLPNQGEIRLKGGVDVATAILHGPHGRDIALAIVVNCQQGEQKALALALHSQADLDATLRLNPDFAYRYGTDLAFHMGVAAAVWAAEHGEPLDGATVPPHLAGWAAGVKTD